jgi:hypothetical protein
VTPKKQLKEGVRVWTPRGPGKFLLVKTERRYPSAVTSWCLVALDTGQSLWFDAHHVFTEPPDDDG